MDTYENGGNIVDIVINNELCKLKSSYHISLLQKSRLKTLHFGSIMKDFLESTCNCKDEAEVNALIRSIIDAILGNEEELYVTQKSKAMLKSLTRLSITETSLVAVTGKEILLHSLDSIFITHCALEEVDLRFRLLTTLDLSHNKLRNVSCMDTPNLKVLNLSHNLLEGDLGSIVDIYSDGGVHCPRLKELNLSHNKLNWSERSRIDALSLLQSLSPALKRITLLPNPFQNRLGDNGGYLKWRQELKKRLLKLKTVDDIPVGNGSKDELDEEHGAKELACNLMRKYVAEKSVVAASKHKISFVVHIRQLYIHL